VRTSDQGILTSHAGSLPRPDDLIELYRARQAGETDDEAGFQQALRVAVTDVVARQAAAGITVTGDGEYGKAMGQKVNYGAWWSYSFSRLGGLDPNGPGLFDLPPIRSEPGHVKLTSFGDRRDPGRAASARSATSATRRSPPTSPTSRPRSPPPANRKVS
jgi:5-methyltetrahydropteroyltriglutamate--homocysteine methyltransferase